MKLKKILATTLVIGAISTGVYAATPTAQQAYYDTFTFKVNGVVQYISDMAKKPFIANSRVYVPISTLSDLGIAKVEWVASNAGLPAELRVQPSQTQTEDKSAYYDQKINELATQIAQKDTKIKELEEKNKALMDENNNLKSDTRKKSSDSDSRDIRNKVSDLERDFNRGRDFNTIKLLDSTYDVEYSFDYRHSRDTFDISMNILSLPRDFVSKIKSDNRATRNIEYLLEDIAKEITRDKAFKDVDIYFTIYDKSNSNSVIFNNYSYRDGRLR